MIMFNLQNIYYLLCIHSETVLFNEHLISSLFACDVLFLHRNGKLINSSKIFLFYSH